MSISLSHYTDIGKRANNEDALSAHIAGERLLAVVADGVGGQDYGEYASRRAVETINSLLQNQRVSQVALERATLRANDAVCALHDRRPGAMTTIAVLWLDGGCAWALNVGDTRIYQFRAGDIVYQSVDHSVAQLAAAAGELPRSEIRTHRDRNKLFRVLGMQPAPRMAVSRLEVRPGDRLLICSDGFWEGILERDMLRCAAQSDNAEDWLQLMRQIAQPAASDNNTAIAVIVG